MDEPRALSEVDEILGSLQDGLKKAEERMTSILTGIVADNTKFMSELEAALTDVEAALASD